MWLVDVYNYDKEIKIDFLYFWFDIVMQFFYIKKIYEVIMKNKSYDYIFGNGKFNTWFNIIVSIISCSAISFCLTELFVFL